MKTLKTLFLALVLGVTLVSNSFAAMAVIVNGTRVEHAGVEYEMTDRGWYKVNLPKVGEQVGLVGGRKAAKANIPALDGLARQAAPADADMEGVVGGGLADRAAAVIAADPTAAGRLRAALVSGDAEMGEKEDVADGSKLGDVKDDVAPGLAGEIEILHSKLVTKTRGRFKAFMASPSVEGVQDFLLYCHGELKELSAKYPFRATLVTIAIGVLVLEGLKVAVVVPVVKALLGAGYVVGAKVFTDVTYMLGSAGFIAYELYLKSAAFYDAYVVPYLPRRMVATPAGLVVAPEVAGDDMDGLDDDVV